jgi:two-component system response regulator AtoC
MNEAARILVADDEKNIREALVKLFAAEGWQAEAVENGLAAQKRLQEQAFSAVVADLKMPGMDGLELLKWCQSDGPAVPFVMISAHGEIPDAVESMKSGAEDYLAKPFDPVELVLRLRRALEAQRDRRLAAAVQPGAGAQSANPEPPPSQAWHRVETLISKAAKTPSLILIQGESGTGKEVLARRIHAQSPWSKGPFIAVNVGALPENLLESELFGYEKGAFTGADRRKLGMFELASGGTIFLDEIGETPLPIQVKLLRVIQERTIQHLGGSVPLPVDARILAATNRDLAHEVREGRFREDLFYRLNVVPVTLPPLRERLEDLPWLCSRLLERLAPAMGKSIRGLTEQALRKLSNYAFPGNVRELENLLERALIFTESDTLTADNLDLPDVADPTTQDPQTQEIPPGTLRDLERKAIETALLKWEGNQTRAAEELGITRRTLFNKIHEYGLTKIL